MTQNILAIHILLSLIQLIHFLSLFVFHFHSSFFSSFLLQESSPTITLVSSKVSSAYAFHLHNNLFIACFSSSFHLRTPYSLRLHESSEINKKAWILRKIELNRKKRISRFALISSFRCWAEPCESYHCNKSVREENRSKEQKM